MDEIGKALGKNHRVPELNPLSEKKEIKRLSGNFDPFASKEATI